MIGRSQPADLDPAAGPSSESAESSGGGRFAVVSSRVAYDGAVIRVRVDDVVMPGGRVAAREVVEHPGAVAVVALDQDESVVLIEQYRHPMGRRLWEIPAGLLDVSGEAPAAAAARELAEETGLAARSWAVLVDVATSPGFTTEVVRVFLARELTDVGRTVPDGDEETDLRIVRVSLTDAVDAVRDGRIVNAAAVTGILATAVLGRTGLRPADVAWPD